MAMKLMNVRSLKVTKNYQLNMFYIVMFGEKMTVSRMIFVKVVHRWFWLM